MHCSVIHLPLLAQVIKAAGPVKANRIEAYIFQQ